MIDWNKVKKGTKFIVSSSSGESECQYLRMYDGDVAFLLDDGWEVYFPQSTHGDEWKAFEIVTAHPLDSLTPDEKANVILGKGMRLDHIARKLKVFIDEPADHPPLTFVGKVVFDSPVVCKSLLNNVLHPTIPESYVRRVKKAPQHCSYYELYLVKEGNNE